MSLIPSANPSFRRRLAFGSASFVVLFLIALGVIAKNGWLMSDPGAVATGFFTGSRPEPPPPPATSLSREYIYAGAGSRLLAVEDANAGSTLTPTPALSYEADMAPRPGGNGVLDSTDVAQWNRFFSGEDTFGPGNECQRADTAPIGTLGDGIFATSSDYQLMLGYAVGNYPLTPAGGPNCSGNRAAIGENSMAGADNGKNAGMAAETATPVPGLEREVRVGTAIGRRGQTVMLPVLMNLRVGETVTVFTLEYDAARLSNPRVSLGANLHPTTVFTMNTREPGKIGVVVATQGASFVAIPIELPLVFITFDVRSTSAIGSTAVNLTSSIAIQSVADRSAALVPTRYTNGNRNGVRPAKSAICPCPLTGWACRILALCRGNCRIAGLTPSALWMSAASSPTAFKGRAIPALSGTSTRLCCLSSTP